MKVYLSAPMTGVPSLNRDWFLETEKALLARGHEVVNPYRLGISDDWANQVLFDLTELRKCDTIIFKDDWQTSEGCQVERIFARKLGLVITDLSTILYQPLLWR